MRTGKLGLSAPQSIEGVRIPFAYGGHCDATVAAVFGPIGIDELHEIDNLVRALREMVLSGVRMK
jgi:hypothetical protein